MQLDARDVAVRACIPGVSLRAAGNTGFLKAFSKEAASLLVDVAGRDGDGLGRCVFCVFLLKVGRSAMSALDGSTSIRLPV